jgi:hypothetical protein
MSVGPLACRFGCWLRFYLSGPRAPLLGSIRVRPGFAGTAGLWGRIADLARWRTTRAAIMLP